MSTIVNLSRDEIIYSEDATTAAAAAAAKVRIKEPSYVYQTGSLENIAITISLIHVRKGVTFRFENQHVQKCRSKILIVVCYSHAARSMVVPNLPVTMQDFLKPILKWKRKKKAMIRRVSCRDTDSMIMPMIMITLNSGS